MDKVQLTAALSSRRYTTVETEGVKLRIQSLTALEKTMWNASRLDNEGNWSKEASELVQERLIAACVVNDAGERLFPLAEDVAFIASWGADSVEVVAKVCLDHVQNTAKAKEVRESTAKN